MTDKKADPAQKSMLSIVAGAKTSIAGEYFKVRTDKPVQTYKTLKAAGVLANGDFSGVSVDKTPKYKKVSWEKVIDPGRYEPAGERTGWSDEKYWAPAEWVGRRTQTVTDDEYDGLSEQTMITTSKRADIRQKGGALFLAQETIDLEKLEAKYNEFLQKKPVADIFEPVVGAEHTKSLTDAFAAVKGIKPLGVKDTLDPKKVSALQGSHVRAVENVKAAVRNSGIIKLLGAPDVQNLVQRACGLDLKLAAK